MTEVGGICRLRPEGVLVYVERAQTAEERQRSVTPAYGQPSLPFGQKHTVIAVLALVYHTNAADVVVIKGEKGVAQQYQGNTEHMLSR